MVDDVNANIGVNIDTSSAIASLKNLQREISLFHTQMARGGATANAQAAQLQSSLLNAVNATGQFQASMTRVNSTTEAFTTALEKNKLTMGQYFRYAGGASKTFGRAFKSEFDTISKVAIERVKDLQTQYISMGRDANGALQSIKVRPLSLDMDNLATRTMVAAQKQQLFNQLLTQGSTNLLNFGKNTQWAGRQLMVGFTIPLTLFATSAAKSFMEIEKQVIKIRRVYGDFSTTVKETDDMVASIKALAGEYTKYGIEVEKTIGLASEAAAAGKTGQELLAQVSEATRLAVLGNVEQTQALETTMSITNAFGTATEQLASKIDFLNAVENQSVTSIEDLTEAIPKAGPVVQQLGGDVEDLAFFLTAMKEGGINASEGANALKSGLAALINPTGKAKEMLQGFGINIEKIVNSNKGDIKGLVIDFASALDTLDPLNRARAIEQLFGKFQFSRLSTLFQNVIGEGTQAARVLELTKATTQELAILSQRELKKVEDTTTYKFEKAFADFQAALAPVGESFLKAVTPVIEFGTKLLNQFNSMGDGAKNFTVILTTVVAGIGPILLMTVGLVANGVANLIKMFQLLGGIFRKTGVDTGILGTQTDYMTQQQIEAAAVAASLNQSHSKLTQTFSVEAAALNALTAAYQKSITAQRGFATPGGRVSRSSTKAKNLATGGIVRGPGSGTSDSIPAMLSNGEAIIPAKQTKKYRGLIEGMIAGNLPGFAGGGFIRQTMNAFKFMFARSPGKGFRNFGFSGMNPFSGPAQSANRLQQGAKISKQDLPILESLNSLINSGMSPQKALAAIQKDPRFSKDFAQIIRDRGGIGSVGRHSLEMPFGAYGLESFARLKTSRGRDNRLQDLLNAQSVYSSSGAKDYQESPLFALNRLVANLQDPRSAVRDSLHRLRVSMSPSTIASKLFPGQMALRYTKNMRHRSEDSNLENNLGHPKDYTPESDINRTFGPGMYFAKNQKLSDTTFRAYGDNQYRQDLSPEAMEIVKKSKGYITLDTLFKFIKKNPELGTDRGAVLPRVIVGGKDVDSRLSGAPYNDPLIQALIKEGYLGYKHGDAFTSWMTGLPGFGLRNMPKPSGYKNGVVSVPGPKGRGDIVPAMLSPGEAVIPAAMAKKYGGLINGMISGSIPGYSRGKGSESNFAHFGPGSSISVQDALSSSDIRLTQAMRRNLEQVVSISKTAVMDLKHAWGAEMSGKTNRKLPSGADIRDVEKEFSGKNITERYGESAKFAKADINDVELQKEIKAYDTAMQQKIASLRKAGVRAIYDTEEQVRALPENQRKFARSIEALDREVATEVGKTNKKFAAMRAAALGQIRDVRFSGAGMTAAERQELLNSGSPVVRQRDSKTKKKRIYYSKPASPGRSFGAMPDGQSAATGTQGLKNNNLTMSEARKVEVRTDKNGNQRYYLNGKQISAKNGQAAIAKVESANNRNAQAREARANRPAPAPAAAPKKPSIGSRIASGVRGGGMGMGMGLSMAGMGVAMIPGLEGLGMAVSVLGPLLMMLPGPIGIAVVALGALGAGVFALVQAQEEQRKKAIELGNAQVMSINSMNKMAEDMGTVSATQSREAEMSAKLTSVKAEELSAAQQYIRETESGKKLLSNTKTMQDSGKSVEQIATSLASDLANSVAQNVITQEQGRQIIAALGVESGNLGISSAASKQFTEYTRDLTKTSGLTTAAALSQATSDFNSQIASSEINSMGGRYTVYEGGPFGQKESKNKARTASTATINTYGQAVGATDAINAQFDTQVAQAKTQDEIDTLEKNRTLELEKQLKIEKEAYETIRSQKAILTETDFNANFLENIKQNFSTDSAMYKTAEKINALGNSTFKTRIQAQLASGTLSPASIEVLMNNASKNKGFGAAYDLAIKAAGEVETLNMISSLQAAGAKVQTQTLMLNIVSTPDSKYTAEQLAGAAQAIEWLNTYGNVSININADNGEVLKAFADDVKNIERELKNNGGKFTTELIAKYTNSTAAANALKDNAAFNKLPKKNKIEYLAQYHAVFSSAVNGNDPGYKGWATLRRKYGMDASAAAYAAAVMDKAATSSVTSSGGSGGDTESDTSSSGGGGGGGTPEDAELVRLNDLKDKQQKALNVIALKEDAINKIYDKRKKALEDIAKINANIADQQKDQLDVAIALTSGDVAAAARAVQNQRVKAASYAQEEQMRALEAKRQAELDGIIVNGKTKEAYEAEIAKLNLQIAERELALANGAATSGGGSGGGSGNGSTTTTPTTTTTPVTTPSRPAAPTATEAKTAAIAAQNLKVSQIGQSIGVLAAEIAALEKQRDASMSVIARGAAQAKLNEKKQQLAYTKQALSDARAKLTSLQAGSGGRGPVAYAMGGLVRYAMGGRVGNRYMASGGSIGSDTISAMLTPGEFVIKRPAVQSFGVKNLQAINSGKSLNGSVYNYSVTVNAGSNASADDIARTVIGKIKQVEATRFKGNRF